MLQKVESLAHYLDLVKAARKQSLVLNTFSLLPGEAERYCEQGLLWYSQTEGGLILAVTHASHSDIQLLASDLRKLSFPVTGTLKFDYVHSADDRQVQAIADSLQRQGFELYTGNLEMTLAPGEALEKKDATGVSVMQAEDVEAVLALFRQTLDPLSHPFPSLQEMQEKHSNYHVLELPEIIGVYRLSQGIGHLAAGHIAVLPQQQRKGYGSTLMRSIEYRRKGKRVKLWVREDNLAAIALYKKHGYERTGRKSLQFVRRGC